jgi:predicted NodU family carbamoyl transferase
MSHNASAALMKDGKIIFVLQEERFTNVKNFTGYPKQSIASNHLDFLLNLL